MSSTMSASVHKQYRYLLAALFLVTALSARMTHCQADNVGPESMINLFKIWPVADVNQRDTTVSTNTDNDNDDSSSDSPSILDDTSAVMNNTMRSARQMPPLVSTDSLN